MNDILELVIALGLSRELSTNDAVQKSESVELWRKLRALLDEAATFQGKSTSLRVALCNAIAAIGTKDFNLITIRRDPPRPELNASDVEELALYPSLVNELKD